MRKTWASGAIELLTHAESHLYGSSAFDKRISFISIDNCVEVMIRTFLSLPKSIFPSNGPSRKELEEQYNSFTGLLGLLQKYADTRINSISFGDIEHYHRIRNKLYHEGTGLSVDEEYLAAYFAIARILLRQLFEIEYDISRNTADKNESIEHLILVWDSIEDLLNRIFLKYDVDTSQTYKWEEIMSKSLITISEIQDLTEIRTSRDRVVRSEKIDYDFLKESIRRAYKLRERFTEILES